MLSGRFILFLFFILCASTKLEAQIQVRVKFNELANLTYQLDCVSDLQIACSRSNLGELWNREFLKSDSDRLMLKEWARVRERYEQEVKVPDEDGGEKLFLSVFDKIRIAGCQATDIEDYTARLDLLTIPSDRSSFEKVIRHFQTRFKDWWQKEATKSGDDFAGQTDILLRSPKISAQITRFYNFYAPDLPANYEISFNLLYVPDTVKESTNGQQLQNYSLMEFKPREKPEQRIDVAVHELNHFFFDSMKAENQSKLAQSFYDARRASAIPAYNLLNETLATAFGNGMITRSVTPPDKFEKYVAVKKSFYNNDTVDRAAKAALPWLDQWLEDKKTIHDPAFAAQYISVLEKAFGEDLITPKLNLSEMFLLIDDKYAKTSLRRDVRQILYPSSLYAVEGDWAKSELLEIYNKQAHINSLFIVHPDNLRELTGRKIITEAQASQIQNELNAKGEVLFNAERSPYTYVYIAVAKDAESVKRLIEKLAGARQFQGIYKS